MAAFFGLVSFILAVLCGLVFTFLLQAKHELRAAVKDLAQHAEIEDFEARKAEIDNRIRKSQAILPKFESLAEMEQHKTEIEKKIRKAQAILPKFQTLEAMQQYKAEIERKVSQTQEMLPRLESLADLAKHKGEIEDEIRQAQARLPKFQTLADMQQHKDELTATLAGFEQTSREWEDRIASQTVTVSNLVEQAEAVEETLDMQSFGLYQPRYGFEDSERYSHELTKVRGQQKAAIKSEEATHCPEQWTVDGSATKGRKMVMEQSKIMLRAFNGECDAALGKVKYNNANNLETRIQRSFEAINKLGKSKHLWITQDYLKLKLQELYLVHEHREKVQEEREEQRRIKDQMREEEKALKEVEKAQKAAEQEESTKTKALDMARKNLESASDKQTDRLKAIVDQLETELKDALERKSKAIARAQLTRSGHVYVLSNIGSFGDRFYKIGMTRRLEPLDRVKELGDASVPFLYDVHAMIYSEDAPKLENTLHKHFASRRVNLVNLRREFFSVTLDEIREAVAEHFGEITFVTVPKAEEFRRTLSIREAEVGADGDPQ